MRKIFVALSLIICCHSLFAQDKTLIVQGTSPNLYLLHIVAPKENYYSIGRLYNTSPKEIAPYNSLQFDKGLTIGQTIKIPLSQNNFTQSDRQGLPVYHIVGIKEGLYRVSVNYNKIPIDELKKWNNLSGDAAVAGTKLIVGYLKAGNEAISPAQKAPNINTPDVVQNNPKPKPETPKEKVIVKITEKEKVPDVITKEPVKEKSGNETIVPANNNAIDFSGGFFKKMYGDQTKNKSSVSESGTVAVFKTTSGWQDGKYYCFHNTALPGTIIKITNTGNGKSVYAKVLDAIPDIKQNTGLLLRISNAAAMELGAGDKFDCSISYSK
ncbi:MAG: LysM peptidoglycan-binding domain-containing protein [Chitinophagaceae bacterium]|nr:LysM peptidoglycan-binding domain-containing protein [Chitinophagaceae bacterium]